VPPGIIDLDELAEKVKNFEGLEEHHFLAAFGSYPSHSPTLFRRLGICVSFVQSAQKLRVDVVNYPFCFAMT
jgi:hypothetical protein